MELSFKDKLRAMRAQTGLSQYKFGALFGISSINVSNWEQGISTPPADTQYMIERLMELDPRIPRLPGLEEMVANKEEAVAEA